MPNFSNGQRKTQLCKEHLRDRCYRKSKNCWFAHGKVELVTHPKQYSKLCTSYLRGACPFGEKCKFLHRTQILEPWQNPIIPDDLGDIRKILRPEHFRAMIG